MEPRDSNKGVLYLPDEGESLPSSRQQQFSVIVYTLVLFSIFAGLQMLWGGLRHTAVERLLIDTLLVKPTAAVINIVTPQVGATAAGRFLTAPGGGIQVVSACTGTEMYSLLIAALLATPLAWNVRLAGILLGVGFIFVLNQLRILTLFYAYRSDLTLFDHLHGIVLPITLVLLTCLFFLWWTARHANNTTIILTAAE